VEVTTWSLEMLDPGRLRPSLSDRPGLALAPLRDPDLARRLYAEVGGPWHWVDRLPWSAERWARHLARDGIEGWVLEVDGEPAGYGELEHQAPNDVEIAYYGLRAPFIGERLGAHLLTMVAERAWALGPRRVWLHTCSLDGEHALANYRARGFEVFREARHVQAVEGGAAE
jgi:ribosomal protein S18 acetylase RimI-like enzyme